MVMSIRMAPLIILIMIQGGFSDDDDDDDDGWGVSYSPSHICALKNSSVIMRCSYKYPNKYKIEKVFWTKTLIKDNGEFPDLSEDPEYSQRLQYLGDQQKICTIRLSHVTLKDSRKYYFRFTANKPNKDDKKWLGKSGVSLSVTDLQVESPERVTEGDSVRLTCKSSCKLTDGATFIWYRNSQQVTTGIIENQLDLGRVRREDAGRYSCAVHGHHHISPAAEINVMYPPRNVSVLINGSSEIVSGDSVTLICSSDSNPPAKINWFKENEASAVGSGQSFSALQSGRFYCQAHNPHGSQRSDAVTVTVQGDGTILTTAIVIAAGCAVLLLLCIIVFIRRGKCGRVSNVKVQEPSRNHCDDGLYARVLPKRTREKHTPGKTESTDSQKISYASILHTRNNETNDENPDPAVRSGAAKDNLVIYSVIK